MRQFELEAKVWVARDDGRLMTLLPTFQPDLGHRQCQAKIRSSADVTACRRSAQAVEGPVDPAAVDRPGSGYIDAVAGVRRHSIAAAATITIVTTNRPTTIIRSTDPSC